MLKSILLCTKYVGNIDLVWQRIMFFLSCILQQEVELALTLDSEHTKTWLEGLSKNIVGEFISF